MFDPSICHLLQSIEHNTSSSPNGIIKSNVLIPFCKHLQAPSEEFFILVKMRTV